MIYRKKYLDKANLRFLKQINGTLDYKLTWSFKKNYSQPFKKRLGFFLQKYSVNNQHNFYRSQNKLYCQITYSSRVPNSKLLLSRFYLVNNVNRLLLAGYQK